MSKQWKGGYCSTDGHHIEEYVDMDRGGSRRVLGCYGGLFDFLCMQLLLSTSSSFRKIFASTCAPEEHINLLPPESARVIAGDCTRVMSIYPNKGLRFELP